MHLEKALSVKRGDVVALVGGGGKTTTLFRLGTEMAEQGLRVVLTTTTRIFAAQAARSPRLLVSPTMEEVVETLAEHPLVTVVGRMDLPDGKAQGIPSEQVDALRALPGVDVIIVEADGSRMRPLKAPAAHEPVIPLSTSLLVLVAGLDAIGQPLDEAHVHRPQQVSELAGVSGGSILTPEAIATVLSHRRGGLKGVPEAARVVVLLNKLDSLTDSAQAEALAHTLLKTARIAAVCIGSVGQIDPIAQRIVRVAGIVLAAGGASRYGAPKQLLPWRGRPLVAHAAQQALAAGLERVVVVSGNAHEQVQEAVAGMPVEVVFNSKWREGQSTSVIAGLAQVQGNGAPVGAALFLLADQPGVNPEVIQAVITAHRRQAAPVVFPSYQGVRGNPVLFDADTFPELATLQGDQGGRPLFVRYKNQLVSVPVDDAGITLDIDQESDYQALKKADE